MVNSGFVGLGTIVVLAGIAVTYLRVTEPRQESRIEPHDADVIRDEALRRVFREFEANLARVINGRTNGPTVPPGATTVTRD